LCDEVLCDGVLCDEVLCDGVLCGERGGDSAARHGAALAESLILAMRSGMAKSESVYLMALALQQC
jgi:hypothetical protein